MERKELGRIKSALWGFGGYQDAQFGLGLVFEGQSWGTTTFIGHWAVERSDHAKWTEAERRDGFADACDVLRKTLTAAKKRHVAELVGTPVEVTFEGNVLKDWRVLTEVL